MARFESGHLLLDSGERIIINDVVLINNTTISGLIDVYATSYYGDGSNLTGVPRSFVDMTDTPTVYSGSIGKFLRVKQDETGVEFGDYTISGDFYIIDEINTISGSIQSEIDAIGSGSDLNLVKYRGVETLSSGVDNIEITFDSELSSTDYIISACLNNTDDTIPSIYFQGIEEKDTTGFKVRLSGNTNSSNYKLEWIIVTSESSDSHTTDIAIVSGGSDGSNLSSIDYFDIATTGDASDFGDLTVSRRLSGSTSNGHNDRGLIVCGPPYTNSVDYVTISTPGNATLFGYLTDAVRGAYGSSTSNNTNERAVYAGDGQSATLIDYWTISTLGNSTSFGTFSAMHYDGAATSNGTNERAVYSQGAGVVAMFYITLSTTGNSTSYGDLTVARNSLCATSNLTNERGIFSSGYSGSAYNIIDYITISTTGNATDFGDLLSTNYNDPGSTSDGTNERGVICGGGGTLTNVIQYVTISTPGNAADFGDLTVAKNQTTATSNA